jgi:hypothetical protein
VSGDQETLILSASPSTDFQWPSLAGVGSRQITVNVAMPNMVWQPNIIG